MKSKICKKCGRTVNCNVEPHYCPWGCGSLDEELSVKNENEQKTKLTLNQQLKLF